jgi:DNA repair protein RadC
LTGVNTCSVGTLTASIVHPREVFKVACVGNASGIIVLHNHPSGDPNPSDEDKRITSRLEEAGQLMGIPLLDHILIGRNAGYCSFADPAEDLPPGGALSAYLPAIGKQRTLRHHYDAGLTHTLRAPTPGAFFFAAVNGG